MEGERDRRGGREREGCMSYMREEGEVDLMRDD